MQFGGQTPLKIAKDLQQAGVNIMGTPIQSIINAEDRKYFSDFIHKLNLQQAPNRLAFNMKEIFSVAQELDYPIIIRPSYVLSGKAMKIIREQKELTQYIEKIELSNDVFPVLLESYLENAIEVDIDAIADANGEVFVAGIMEHIEFAGIHSGDSSCSLPPHSLSMEIQEELFRQIRLIARELKVVGFINAQFAIKDDLIYVLEIKSKGF